MNKPVRVIVYPNGERHAFYVRSQSYVKFFNNAPTSSILYNGDMKPLLMKCKDFGMFFY